MKLLGRKIRKAFFCIALAAVLMTTSVATYYTSVQAATITTATIKGGGVRMRSGPGISYSEIAKFSTGATGSWIETQQGTDQGDTHKWHKVTISGKTGWVRDDLITITSVEVGDDAAFEAQLTAQGFPESYKPALRLLHKKYPNWIFEAQNTGLNWDDVIAGESVLGRNLVQSTAQTSWKSTENGAYDWKTGTWYVFDSGGWVAASTPIIKYYMDPRNFLDSTNVFQFLKQSYDASTVDTAVVRSNLKNMVVNTFLANGYDKNKDGTINAADVTEKEAYLDDIMQAAQVNKVSPYVLAAMILQEQGTDGDGGGISGTNSKYGEKYVGYYNFFNIGAYKDDGMEAIERGLWYASGSGVGSTSYYRPWDNRTDSILGGSKHYGEDFVAVGQDTMYLKKFDLIGTLYTHQYMTNVGGAYGEGRFMAGAYNETARQSALVFKIPVYNNMPEQQCPMPTGNGDPNYMLTALSVNGYSLTPTFSMYETYYSLIVPNNVSSVTINATAASSKAKITGTGTQNLNVGSNAVKIAVTAEDGSVRTYTINIVRNSSNSSAIPTISSSTYKVSGNTITGIQPGVTVDKLKSGLKASNATITVYNANGSINTGNVGTGNMVRVSNGSGATDYTIIVYGDISGDGKVTSLDLLQLKRHIVKASTLKGVYSTAADTSKDGAISSLDLLQVKRHIVGAASIQQ